MTVFGLRSGVRVSSSRCFLTLFGCFLVGFIAPWLEVDELSVSPTAMYSLNTGQVIVKKTPPAGTYTFRMTIIDDCGVKGQETLFNILVDKKLYPGTEDTAESPIQPTNQPPIPTQPTNEHGKAVNPRTSPESKKDPLNNYGWVIGVVIGVIAIVVLVAFIIFLTQSGYCKSHRTTPKETNGP